MAGAGGAYGFDLITLEAKVLERLAQARAEPHEIEAEQLTNCGRLCGSTGATCRRSSGKPESRPDAAVNRRNRRAGVRRE